MQQLSMLTKTYIKTIIKKTNIRDGLFVFQGKNYILDVYIKFERGYI